MLHDVLIVPIGLLFETSQLRSLGNGELVHPDFATARSQVLLNLAKLVVESGLLHPVEVPHHRLVLVHLQVGARLASSNGHSDRDDWLLKGLQIR